MVPVLVGMGRYGRTERSPEQVRDAGCLIIPELSRSDRARLPEDDCLPKRASGRIKCVSARSWRVPRIRSAPYRQVPRRTLAPRQTMAICLTAAGEAASRHKTPQGRL